MKWPKLPSTSANIIRWAGHTVETLVEALQGGGIHFWAGETVTVSTVLRTITDWFPAPPLTQVDLVTVVFQVVSGGPIEISVNAAIPAAAGGGNGEFQRNTLDAWKVTGRSDIVNFSTIRATGGTDAVVRAEMFVHDVAPAPS